MAKTLDFTNPAAYFDAIEWVRDNLILQPKKGAVEQLDIELPKARATVFMDLSSGYILGFQGKEKDRVYILFDSDSASFEKSLKVRFPEKQTMLLKGLRASHAGGDNSLGSIGSDPFSLWELGSVRRLAEFSYPGNYSDIRRPLSLLVFMISESARFPMVQRDFKNIYSNHPVLPDEAVQSFHDAKQLIALAAKYLPGYSRAHAIEKFKSRLREFDELIRKLSGKAPGEILLPNEERQIVVRAMKGAMPGESAALASASVRMREMSKELHMQTAKELNEFLTAMRNSVAVRAAWEGVAIPPVGTPILPPGWQSR